MSGLTAQGAGGADITPETWRGLVRAAVDLALLVDPRGVIRDVSLGEGVADLEGVKVLLGQSWVSSVATDSRGKAEALLGGQNTRAREVNLEVAGIGQLPFRFSAVTLQDPQGTLMVGRDQRPVAALQQRMVSLQQTADREYARLRQADTRYRLFFHVSAEAVLVTELDGLRVLEANPASGALFGAPPSDLVRQSAYELIDADSRKALESLVSAVSSGARPTDLRVTLKNRASPTTVSISLFRQSGTPLVLLRLWESSERENVVSASSARLQAIIEAMPDSFVVVGDDRRILSANAAFCELVSQANEQQVLGEPIERWLGRAGVDLKIMFANLKEHSSVRNFSTIIRTDVGPPQEAVVTAVSVNDGKVHCVGFAIRPAASRLFMAPSALPRSVDQLKELVGRVPIKEIVRESADLIERLCIQAALDVSDNNRASAAQLLGLSRQGLYSKLRRYGLVSTEPA